MQQTEEVKQQAEEILQLREALPAQQQETAWIRAALSKLLPHHGAKVASR